MVVNLAYITLAKLQWRGTTVCPRKNCTDLDRPKLITISHIDIIIGLTN